MVMKLLLLATLISFITVQGTTGISTPAANEADTEFKTKLSTESRIEPKANSFTEPDTPATAKPTAVLTGEARTNDGAEIKNDAKSEYLTQSIINEGRMTSRSEFGIEHGTTQPAPESTTQRAPEPTTQRAPEQTTQPAPEPTTQFAAEPTTQPAPEPTTQFAPEPTTQFAAEQTTQPAPEPTTQFAAEPTTQPAPEPTTQRAPELTTQRAPEPTTQPAPEPTTQFAPELTTQRAPELTTQRAPEPTTQFATELKADTAKKSTDPFPKSTSELTFAAVQPVIEQTQSSRQSTTARDLRDMEAKDVDTSENQNKYLQNFISKNILPICIGGILFCVSMTLLIAGVSLRTRSKSKEVAKAEREKDEELESGEDNI